MDQAGAEEPIPLLPRSGSATSPNSPFFSQEEGPRKRPSLDQDDDDDITLAPNTSAHHASAYRRRTPRQVKFDNSPESLQKTLYALLELPNSSPAAFTVHLLSNSLITLSALLTILETLPFFHHVPAGVWFGLETAIVVLFTVEYGCRNVAWSDSWSNWWGWFTSFFGIVDLLAILPYYIEIALRADTTAFFRFSILRTFRLLRVFRPFRYSNTILLTIEVMIVSMRRSKDALLALAFFVMMALVVFSTLLYFAERGTWDDGLETFVDEDGVKSQFESIPAAAWFVLVTITTVGYGEIIPRSFLGRVITVPLLLFGLLLIALPSFVLGREFSMVWEEMGSGVLRSLRQANHRNEDGEHGVVFDADDDDEEANRRRPQRTDSMDSAVLHGHPGDGPGTPHSAQMGGSMHEWYTQRMTSRHSGSIGVEKELKLLRKEREEFGKLLSDLKEELRLLREARAT